MVLILCTHLLRLVKSNSDRDSIRKLEFSNFPSRSLHSKYWMIYRGPGFLVVVWFGSSPTPSPPLPTDLQEVVSLSQTSCVSPVELTDRRGGGGGGEPSHTTTRKHGPLHDILWGTNSKLLFQFYLFFLKGGFFYFSFYARYSTLLYLPPLKFHNVVGCWDRTQCWNFRTIYGGLWTE